MNDHNEDEKQVTLWNYSLKMTAVGGILFGSLSLYYYFFGDSRLTSLLFGIVFIAMALITLRYFYLWFR